MEAPISQTFYVVDAAGDIQVHFPDFSGETDGYDATLREGTFDDIHPDLTLYVEVDYPLEYPYSGWDCEEVAVEDLAAELGWEPRQPRKFAEAAVVFSPKMKVI